MYIFGPLSLLNGCCRPLTLMVGEWGRTLQQETLTHASMIRINCMQTRWIRLSFTFFQVSYHHNCCLQNYLPFFPIIQDKRNMISKSHLESICSFARSRIKKFWENKTLSTYNMSGPLSCFNKWLAVSFISLYVCCIYVCLATPHLKFIPLKFLF